MERDPVCGMTVDPKTTAWKSDDQGKTYYFCSEDCKATFDQNPAKYANAPSGEPMEHHHH